MRMRMVSQRGGGSGVGAWFTMDGGRTIAGGVDPALTRKFLYPTTMPTHHLRANALSSVLPFLLRRRRRG